MTGNHFREHLHEEHGHRLCILQQHVRDGDLEQARYVQGQVDALAKLLEALDMPDEEHGTPNYPHYAELSRARIEAEREARDGSGGDLRGLQ